MATDRALRRLPSVLPLLVAVAVLAACSGSGSSGSGPSGSPSRTSSSASPSGSPTVAPRVARIGVLSSDTGVLGSTGKGVRNSVELAVREANLAGALPGWTFEVVAANDASTQSAGQQAASGLAANPSVIGVVGTLRSTIDEGVQPILNDAGIPMISPGGTSVQLTRRLDGVTPVRPFATYFRLSPTDPDQGPAAARFAVQRLKATKVAVINDNSSYGRLLAGGFAVESRRLRVSPALVRTLAVPPSLTTKAADAKRARLAAAVRRADVDVVFFGGTSAQAAAFADALRVARVRVPVMGGDALLDGRFVADAGALASAGDLAVFPGAAPESLVTARGFVRRYSAAGLVPAPGPYGANAYDAATALIRAFRTAVAADRPTASPTAEPAPVTRALRAEVVAALSRQQFVGATGPVRFDRFGDVIDPPLSLYRFAGTRWRVAGVVRLG